MKSRIINVGNSKGIRIPKVFIEETGLNDEVEILVQGNTLVIVSAKQPREGWSESFAKMNEEGEDKLLDSDIVTTSIWDRDEWKWE